MLTVSAAALATGLLIALRLLGVAGLTTPRVIAVALLAVGAGLLVGTWYGRARWLIVVGLLLALALGATAGAQRAGVDGGVGQRTWVPSGSASYRLGAGEGVLDLRELRPGQRAQISARIGAGSLRVLVPDGLAARVVADVDLGEVSQAPAPEPAGPPRRARTCTRSSSSAVPPTPSWRSAWERSRCAMERHERDAVCLMAGLLLVLVAGPFLVGDLTGLSVDARWTAPVVLIAVGVAGVLSTLRSRDDATDDTSV